MAKFILGGGKKKIINRKSQIANKFYFCNENKKNKNMLAAENIAEKIFLNYELNSLNAEVKKCLAIKLLCAPVETQHSDNTSNLNWLYCLSGAWETDGLSADEEAEMIRNARFHNSTRQIEEL